MVTSFGEIVDLAAFATVGPYPVLASNVVIIIGRNIILKRSDPARNIFNLGQLTLACLAGYFILKMIQVSSTVTFSWISLLAIICAWFTYSSITTGLVSLVISTHTNSLFHSVWIQNYSREFIVSLASAPLALVMAVLYLDYGSLSVLLLAVPLVGLSTLVGFWMERARLQARVERESQLAEMGKATATVLHELSRPINRIIMTSDFAISGGMSETAALENILSDAKDANQLSERLVGVIKVKVKRSAITVEELIAKLCNRLESEGITFTVSGLKKCARLVGNWDGDLIITALLNLVKNAWESQNSQGPLPEMRIERDSEPSGSSVYSKGQICSFIVSDHGPGLPPGVHTDIFEALYSTKEAGFGIGLFIANQIAMAHSGQLRARNAEFKGAVFTLDLPLTDNVKIERDKR